MHALACASRSRPSPSRVAIRLPVRAGYIKNDFSMPVRSRYGLATARRVTPVYILYKTSRKGRRIYKRNYSNRSHTRGVMHACRAWMRYHSTMANDKYGAVWVSHSSMGDFLKCPRAYYLHNVYKDPKTGRKMTIVNGALSLGQAVHTTLENLKTMPVADRLARDLFNDYEEAWKNIAGKKGGFKSDGEEREAKERGRAMIARVVNNPGPIARKTVRLKEHANGMPPNFFLSDDDNIILCGLIDWLEYRDTDDSICVIDFKTGRHAEDADSLQLPIYVLLLQALQKRAVTGAAYWYLEKDNEPLPVALPDVQEAKERVLAVARRVKEARETRTFECPHHGCFACRPYEAILCNEAEYIGVGGYGQDVYMV